MICIGFLLATYMAIAQSALFPWLIFFPYAPFIALLCMHTSVRQSLWLAALAGLFCDFLSRDPIGMHALTAVIAATLLHHFQLKVFKDQPLQLCFYTALISLMMIPLQLILLFLFDQHFSIDRKSILLDFIQIPLVDAAYAFFWFVGPLLLWEWLLSRYKVWRMIHHDRP